MITSRLAVAGLLRCFAGLAILAWLLVGSVNAAQAEDGGVAAREYVRRDFHP